MLLHSTYSSRHGVANEATHSASISLLYCQYPVVYGDGYGFTPGQIGLAFIPIGIGMISCCLYSIFIDTKFYVRAVTKAKGVRVPEMRIPFALFSAILVPICE